MAGDGAGARSKVRALERQLKGEGDRADRADRARRRAEAQLQQPRAAVCMLTDAHADGTGTLWGGGGGGGGGDRLSDETTQRSPCCSSSGSAPPLAAAPLRRLLFATLAGGGGGGDGGDGGGGDSAAATPRSASGSENASPQPLTRAQRRPRRSRSPASGSAARRAPTSVPAPPHAVARGRRVGRGAAAAGGEPLTARCR